MSGLTLQDAWAEFELAGCTPTPPNGKFEATCPVCQGRITAHPQDGELPTVELHCSSGCTRSKIADALHVAAIKAGALTATGQLPPETPTSSWQPVDLAPILAGGQIEDPPSILLRSDGYGLIYPGRVHAIYGEPEACKGWFALAAAVDRLHVGRGVLYIDYEDTPASIAGRLTALGVDAATIVNRFQYVRPEEPVTETPDGNPALVIVDGVTEALAVEGLDMAANQDVAEWFKRLARPLARAGAAVVLLDHVTKDQGARGRYAIGAQHKLAGVDVAYRLEVIRPFGREREGLVKIVVTKDRPGFISEHAPVGDAALFRLASKDGRVTVTVDAPDAATGTFRPTVLMERVSRAIETTPGMSKRAIRETVNGQHAAKETALTVLIAEEYVHIERTARGHEYTSIKPYRDDDDPQRAPCPDRAPTVPGHTSDAPCPVPPTPRRGARSRARPHDDDPHRAQAERLEADHPDLAAGGAS